MTSNSMLLSSQISTHSKCYPQNQMRQANPMVHGAMPLRPVVAVSPTSQALASAAWTLTRPLDSGAPLVCHPQTFQIVLQDRMLTRLPSSSVLQVLAMHQMQALAQFEEVYFGKTMMARDWQNCVIAGGATKMPCPCYDDSCFHHSEIRRHDQVSPRTQKCPENQSRLHACATLLCEKLHRGGRNTPGRPQCPHPPRRLHHHRKQVAALPLTSLPNPVEYPTESSPSLFLEVSLPAPHPPPSLRLGHP
mmetsp:Transcript_21955/g.64878  ORF Transcript_21955/g.64878 Transcript_21955/m.64878 type:complete len:248 (-) Transcript_21955:1636-2379(-)